MNIDGLGEKIVDQLHREGSGEGFRRSVQAGARDLADLERMAEKSAQNLLDEIEASKKNSLARLIYASEFPSSASAPRNCWPRISARWTSSPTRARKS